MYISQSFIPILKNNPSEAKIKSHQLMLRVGMIKQSSAGIYSWLPLGFKVMKKIEDIVREEQNKIGAQEILMPTIQSSEIWKESGRYEDYGEEMLRIKDRQNREMLYGPTNEELVTDIFRASVKSYKSLPQLLYHIQWKFRDEIRPSFGIMRCREFYMKDAYSFDISDEEALFSYNKFFLSYLKTFKRLDLTAIPMAGAARGAAKPSLFSSSKPTQRGWRWLKLDWRRIMYCAADLMGISKGKIPIKSTVHDSAPV